MKTIYYHGNIITMDERYPQVEALCVDNGHILKVGTKEEVFSLKDEDTKLIDLNGKTMLPGFIDSHSHLSSLANSQRLVDLSRVTNFNDLINTIKEFIKNNQIKKGDWVIGQGYDHNFMEEKRHPDRHVLDLVSNEHPILISHSSLHMGVANTMALEKVGIDENTKDIDGGKYKRVEGSNTPNGYMEENAFIEFQKQLPMIKAEDMLLLFEKAQKIYASYGITTVQEGMIVKELFPLLQYAANQHKLFLDVIGYVDLNHGHSLTTKHIEYVKKYQNRFKIGGYKIFLDGSPQGRTAWMSTPYKNDKDYYGYPTLQDKQLYSLIKTALDEDMQLLAHCNGDAAAEQYITQFEDVVRKEKKSDTNRPVMIHAQLVRYDQLQRMVNLHMIPSFFMAHTYYWGDIHITNFGKERANKISLAKSAKELGLCYTLHQDTPVIMPNMMETVWCAVNRETRNGISIGKEECIEVDDALKAITMNAAYQYFEENYKGSLTKGKVADMVILDNNPYTVPKHEIRNIEVLATFKEGICVYQKQTHKILYT